MKKLIDDIKNRLSDKVTDLKYIDEDWGQLDYYSPNQPVKWPCLLIDVDNALWSNEAMHIQAGMIQVSIRVANMRLSNSNIKAPAKQIENSYGIFDLLTNVHKALHGWTADTMNGPLTRVATRKVKRDDGIREFEVIYSTRLVDDSAAPETEMYPMTRQKIKVTVEKITVT